MSITFSPSGQQYFKIRDSLDSHTESYVSEPVYPECNFSNVNAHLLLEIMGYAFTYEEGAYVGRISDSEELSKYLKTVNEEITRLSKLQTDREMLRRLFAVERVLQFCVAFNYDLTWG